ncbi:MAG TPA: DUF2254 family protein [Myxococcaceae bacterium]|nr:DUF2254 family protein [Myxococcaceae bacterium]
MPPRLEKLWSAIRSSLWFRPVLFVSWGVLLGLALPAVDRAWPELGEAVRAHWLASYVPGTPSSSREVLVAMLTALITVVAVTASMTMVTVQLASTQYTPRLLRRYMADAETQRVLGAYLLTVVYLLLVLGAVSGGKEDGAAPPPVLTLGTALLLTVACLLLLPHYLHHTARSVEASVINRVHRAAGHPGAGADGVRAGGGGGGAPARPGRGADGAGGGGDGLPAGGG